MKLYAGRESLSSQIVRLVLAVKGIEHELVSLELSDYPGGLERTDAVPLLNECHELPSLLHNGELLTQPLAIAEYIEEIEPKPALLPEDRVLKARIRAYVQKILAHIQLCEFGRLDDYPVEFQNAAADKRLEWLRNWLSESLVGLEFTLAHQSYTGTYCFGEKPSLADLALVPLLQTVKQLDLSMSAYPHIARISENCVEQEWCRLK